ncbi:type II membrane protein [Kickxella alabastrina]|uniref:Type II membrane protein n=1 Tax=Kickxella alabastrina TaxID=61397 RepID=A0ACC1IIT2_9FUNG|nr:type II membrane protein [Kickxella alabastrina]
MRPFFTLAILASAAIHVTSAAFSCKNAQIAGFAYDLSALARDTILERNATTAPTITNTKYVINPCAPLQSSPDSVPKIDQCPENAWVCRSVTNYKDKEGARLTEVNSVGGNSKSDEPTLQATTSGSDRPAEFHWKMGGAEVDGVKWSTDIKFVCNKGAKNEDSPKLVALKDGLLELEWSVPAACALGDDGKDKAPEDDNKDGDKGGDKDGEETSGGGFFSTVFSLFISGLVLYLVLGVMYNYLVVRATGMDVIPNLAFWREFPYLCTDFAQHIWDTVSGRRRGGYSVV